MSGCSSSYLSPKCVVVNDPTKGGGRGVVARAPIAKGEPVCVWGGRVISSAEVEALTNAERAHAVQVEEGLYLAVLELDEPASYFNHSCSPNAGFSGQIVLVAMRDIDEGEEVTFDYAMSDGSPYDEFECHCGSPECRGRITGDDWRNPDLWERYAGLFSPYLQRRIDQLKERGGGE
jgi:uncharacterized protein